MCVYVMVWAYLWNSYFLCALNLQEAGVALPTGAVAGAAGGVGQQLVGHAACSLLTGLTYALLLKKTSVFLTSSVRSSVVIIPHLAARMLAMFHMSLAISTMGSLFYMIVFMHGIMLLDICCANLRSLMCWSAQAVASDQDQKVNHSCSSWITELGKLVKSGEEWGCSQCKHTLYIHVCVDVQYNM